MKKILVLSDPPAAPGYLPRLRFLCDYLVQRGYDVTLLTEQSQPLPFEHSYPIVTIPMYSGSTLDWALKTLWTLLTDWHNRAFARKANQQSTITRNEVNRALAAENHQWDVVLCTTFSDFPLGAGLRIARHLNIPLVCDIRDLDEQIDNSRYQYRHQYWWTMPFIHLYRAIHRTRRNRVLRSADAITTISPWHAEFIRNLTVKRSYSVSGLTAKNEVNRALVAKKRSYSAAVSIVYNGFDPAQFYPKDIKTDRFTISYIGSLFDWQQPALSLVQQAINELNKSSISNLQSPIFLEIHTPKSNPLSHDQLGDAIRSSSIMLVLTNPCTHGMLTTKFYEALGCEKPILCVPSDQGALASLFAQTHAGIATGDIETIKAFILDRYREWQTNGFTRQPVIPEKKDLFSRDYQSQQLEQILLSVAK